MTVYSFIHPTDSPGPRRPILPSHLFLDLPLQGMGRTSITRAQTPPIGITRQEKGDADVP